MTGGIPAPEGDWHVNRNQRGAVALPVLNRVKFFKGRSASTRPLPDGQKEEMTKELFRAFTMLVLIMMIAFASAVVSVYAQF